MSARLRTYVITDRGGGEARGPARDRPDRLLFLLHGYGATEHDLTSLGPLLDPEVHFLIAGPRGPVAIGDGAAWFAYGPLGPEPTSFHHAVDALQVTLDGLCAEHLLGRDEVVIGGFSQGAAMALALALGADDRPPPAAVICLSGFLADVDGLTYDWARLADVPVLVQHGRRDEVVPVELGRDTATTLHHHGLRVTWHEYDMGHQTTLESLTDARTWLTGVRDGERPSAPPP